MKLLKATAVFDGCPYSNKDKPELVGIKYFLKVHGCDYYCLTTPVGLSDIIEPTILGIKGDRARSLSQLPGFIVPENSISWHKIIAIFKCPFHQLNLIKFRRHKQVTWEFVVYKKQDRVVCRYLYDYITGKLISYRCNRKI